MSYRLAVVLTIGMVICTIAISSVGKCASVDKTAKDPAKLRVAAVSCLLWPGAPKKNLPQVEKWTVRAAEKGADIVLFNETSVTGYWQNLELRKLAEPLHGPTVRKLTDLAAKHDIVIAAGIIEECYGKQFNTHVLVGPKGLAGFHRKSSLPGGEERWFDCGHDSNVTRIRGWKVGVAICYESVAPDTCRKLAAKGAEVILAPYRNGVTAKDIADGKRPYFSKRAQENGVWYVACDQCAEDWKHPGQGFSPGAVCFVNPKGEIVVTTSLDEDEEHMIVYDLDKGE